MSRLSFFQRYAQRENHSTNNAMLLLRRFYQASPGKIDDALTSILDEQVSIGLGFDLQVRTDRSTPDALISQRAVNIYVEAKTGNELFQPQIENHLAGIAAKQHPGDVFLVGLTKNQIDSAIAGELRQLAHSHGIKFAICTFSQLASALRDTCAAYEADLNAVLDDFETYLEETGLSEDRNRWLPVMPCGQSLAENVKFHLYYEGTNRPLKRSPFIGIYANKCVRYIGKVQAIVVCEFGPNGVALETEQGDIPSDGTDRIEQVAEATAYYQLKSYVQRYYLMEPLVRVDIDKTTPGGLMGMRYLDLRQLAGTQFDLRRDYSGEELAQLMRGKTFD